MNNTIKNRNKWIKELKKLKRIINTCSGNLGYYQQRLNFIEKNYLKKEG
jgi:hypothetical protein